MTAQGKRETRYAVFGDAAQAYGYFESVVAARNYIDSFKYPDGLRVFEWDRRLGWLRVS